MRKGLKKTLLFIVTGLLAAMLTNGCGDSDSNGSGRFDKGTDGAFVVTSDYTTGSYSAIDLETLVAGNDLPATTGIVHSDCVAVSFKDKIYLVNRLGADNITVLDTEDLSTAVSQFSVGDGLNPHDIAFVSNSKAYVALYASNNLLVVDPTDIGNEIQGTIDLSSFADTVNDPTDGAIEATALEIVGDYLFVLLQRYDMTTYSANADGLIVVIDTNDNTIVDTDAATEGVQAITLTGRNPQFMEYDNNSGKLIVSETGGYFAADGGFETVDPDTFEAEGFIISETDTYTAAGPFAVIDGSIFVAIAEGYGSPVVMEYSFDADTMTCSKVQDIFTATAYLPCLTADGYDRILITDRDSTSPGVRFYDPETGILGAAIDVGLPPAAIVTF